MENFDLIVIGGGPAGITLAKMLGKKMKMAIIRPENYSMIYCAMPYAIEGILKQEKTLKKDSLVTESGAELIRDTVTKIDFAKKQLFLTSSKKLSWDKLVIATGASPFIPPVPGANLGGITGFKTETDMIKIESMIKSGSKNAVVVGAGAIGIELAQALKERDLNVHLIDMAANLLPNMTDPEIVEPALEELIRKGIHLHFKAKVIELKGKDNVEQIILDNGDIIHFSDSVPKSGDIPDALDGFVVFATGMTPNISLVKGSDVKTDKDGIVVNEKMETNVQDVYAVGDCVQFKSGITNQVVAGKLATNAVPMAKILGFNLRGQDRNYEGFYNGAATKTGKFYVGGTGLTERNAKSSGFDTVIAYSEVTSQFPMMPNATRIHLKLIADRKTKLLIGAQIIGEVPVTDKIDLLSLAIQNKIDIKRLTALSYSAQPYQSFFPAANLIVLAAEKLLEKF